MSIWSEIYKKQMSEFDSLDSFINYKLDYKIVLINTIKKYARTTKKILEAGCGSGITCTFLAQKGYNVTGVDSDPDMVELATSIAEKQSCSALFKIDDIRLLNTLIDEHFDVVFSNGVMEHFSDAEIISILNQHLLVGDYVIVSIPSDYFTETQKIYGNERFLGKEKWVQIISLTKGKIVEEFSFNSDPSKIHKEIPQFIGFVITSL